MATKKSAVETTEEKYERAKRLEVSVKSLLRDKERGEIYQKASDLYASLGEYEDAQKRSEDCAKKAKEFREKYKQQEKERKQAEKETKEEENQDKKYLQRKIKLALLAIIILAMGCTAVFLKLKPGCYFRADLFERIGYYEKSYKMFHNLKDYKDSEDRYLESYYKYGIGAKDAKEYEKAKTVFRKLEDYKDSEEQLTGVEMEMIKASKVGDDVLFGEYRWMVLEKDDEKVFLAKMVPVNGVAYDSKDAETWENASVREYLNGEFLEETFNDSAKKHILKTTVEFSTESDKTATTEDELFFLTAKQAEQYQEILSNYLRDWWVLDSGKEAHTAQFVSRGVVMEYGYEKSNDNIFIRPAMWITMK
jgi:tetratricopeptide (TPR) repeat protein